MADTAAIEKRLKEIELESEILRIEEEMRKLPDSGAVLGLPPVAPKKEGLGRVSQVAGRLGADTITGYGKIGGALLPGVTSKEVGDWAEQNIANRFGPRIPLASAAMEEIAPGLLFSYGTAGLGAVPQLVRAAPKTAQFLRDIGSIGPVRLAAASAGGGAGAELGEQIGERAGYPMTGRVVGGVVGGLPAMIPGPSAAQSMLREASKGLTPEQLFEASRLIEMGRGRGGVQPGQALEYGGSMLTDLQRRTMAALRGTDDLGMTQEAIQQAPRAAEGVKRTAGMLGPAGDASEVATRAQIAASTALRNMERMAGPMAYGPEIPKRFSEADLIKTAELLDRYAAMVPARAGIAKAVRDELMSYASVTDQAAAGLPKGNLAQAAKTQGVQDVAAQRRRMQDTGGLLYGDVASMITRLRQGEPPLALSKAGIQRLKGGEADDVIGILKDNLLGKVNPDIDLQDAAFRQAQKQVIEPAKEGFLGGVATKGGYAGPPETAPQRLTRYFSLLDDINPQSKSIKYAASQMNDADPGAFRQLVANWLDNKATKAVVPGQGFRGASKEFAESLLKNPNLDSIMESAAIGYVEKPAEFARGFRDALRVLQAQGRPAAMPDVTPELTEALRREGTGWFARYMTNNSAIGQAAMRAQAIKDFSNRRQFMKLSKVFNSPDAMRLIAESARYPIVSERKQALIYAAIAASTPND